MSPQPTISSVGRLKRVARSVTKGNSGAGRIGG
jgi:hypothetical protein